MKTTASYKKLSHELNRFHPRPVPSFSFILANNFLHSIFLPEMGAMIYQVSNDKEELERFSIREAVLSPNGCPGSFITIIKTTIPNLWIVLEFDSAGGQLTSFAQDDYVTEFKKRNYYTTNVTHIGPQLHELALRTP